MDKEIRTGCGGSGGDGGGGGGRSRSYSRRNCSRERELGPPAFLTKTYTIVDDPNTNSIISWGESGYSFIIWDHLTFSADILPKYFKHSNLSSFVYQLNSYGFRKIGVDHQWEYINPDFQKGKLHLLKNILRRGQNMKKVTRHRHKRTLYDSVTPEILMNEMNELKMEIKKLISQQDDMELHIMAMEEDAKNAEMETKKLIDYWGKACEIIAEKLREETGRENNDDHEAKRIRKLDINPEKEMSKLEDAIPLSDENQPAVSSTNENDDHEANAAINSESMTQKNSADHYAYWNSVLLGDDYDIDEAYEGEERTEMAEKKAKIALEFENLIIKMKGS